MAAQGRHDELGLSRVRGRCGLGKDGVKSFGRIRSAQLRHNVMIAQQAGDAGERLQMISTGVFGRQEQENEIDRLIVDRVELDGRGEAGEKPIDPGQCRDLAMRNGDAMAQARRAELLALQESLEDHPVIDCGQLGGSVRDFLQELLLVLDLEARQDRL